MNSLGGLSFKELYERLDRKLQNEIIGFFLYEKIPNVELLDVLYNSMQCERCKRRPGYEDVHDPDTSYIHVDDFSTCDFCQKFYCWDILDYDQSDCLYDYDPYGPCLICQDCVGKYLDDLIKDNSETDKDEVLDEFLNLHEENPGNWRQADPAHWIWEEVAKKR